jgi:pantoate kinase
MREASAFAPGHLTGFFQICDQPEDPLLKGSRGAGASITRGVRTRVTAEPSEKKDYSIFIDGKESRGAFVSENVLDKILEKLGEPHRVVVEHTVEIPLGAGFGSSGGGALTLSMALNEALRLGMSFTETARVAHVAEIECRTGLGTVFAATVGGFGALVKAGGPGIGEAVKYDRSGDLSVVYLHYGPMATKDALSNPSLRMKINELGGNLVDRIKDDLRPDLFMELSRKFTDHVGITTPRLMRILKTADDEGIPCAMAMFGEVVFTLTFTDEAEIVADFFRSVAPRRNIVTVQVEDEGAKLINK